MRGYRVTRINTCFLAENLWEVVGYVNGRYMRVFYRNPPQMNEKQARQWLRDKLIKRYEEEVLA